MYVCTAVAEDSPKRDCFLPHWPLHDAFCVCKKGLRISICFFPRVIENVIESVFKVCLCFFLHGTLLYEAEDISELDYDDLRCCR